MNICLRLTSVDPQVVKGSCGRAWSRKVPASAKRKRGFYFFVSLAILLGLAHSAPAQDTDSLRTSLGNLLKLQPFALEDMHGRTMGPQDMLGKVWVAHFFYTTCTAGCTKTVPTMRELQQFFRGKRDVVLVSISLNSDTPEDLQRYAGDLEADTDQWFFLTGPREKVHDIVQKCFFQTAQVNPEGKQGQEIDHSFNLVVVDARGEMQGYVDGTLPGAAERVRDRIRELVRPKYLLPAINAGLNFFCAVLLTVGYLGIRRQRETFHKVFMLTALVVSTVFLVSYLYFHFAVVGGQPTRFRGEGLVRFTYFGILLSHTFLAALVAPLALYITYQGIRDQRRRHTRVARWTLPLWLYVSGTGVIVYLMLYHFYPPY